MERGGNGKAASVSKWKASSMAGETSEGVKVGTTVARKNRIQKET